MPEVYASTLDLIPIAGVDPFVAFHQALREWVGDRWPANVPWFRLDEPDSLRADNGSIFRWEPYNYEGRALFEFNWRHAHVDDPSITWSTRCALYQAQNGLRLSLIVANTGPGVGLPGQLLTTRPRLLLSLLGSFGARSDGYPVSTTPRIVTERSFTDFARYYLHDRRRAYPIILLTPRADGQFEVVPETIGREFLTLAEVYYAETPQSTFVLTDEVGKRLSVFCGALRVYMPGFTAEDDPFRHPLVLPKRLADPAERLRLAGFLASLTVRRFHEDPVLPELRDERAVRAEERRRSLLQDLQSAHTTAARDAEEWARIAEDLDKENRALKARIDNLEEQLDAAQGTIKALQESFRQFQAAQGVEASPPPEPQFSPESVLEAVEMADLTFGDNLLILPTALEAAANSPYERPGEVFRALGILADIAKRMAAGPLGRNLSDVIRENGLDYGAGLSPNTPKKMRQQYQFTDSDTVHRCEQHLNLGSSAYDPKECLRIYFNSEERPDGKIVVGHVGRHLDVLTTT